MDYVVYALVNTIAKKRYIGSTEVYVKRQSQHLKRLRSGTHSNNALQTDWDTQQGQGFKFKVLRRFRTRHTAYNYEAAKIKRCRPNKIYNILLGGQGGDAVTRNPNRSLICLKHSINGKRPEQLERLKQFQGEGDKNANWRGGSKKCPKCSSPIGWSAKTCGKCRTRNGKKNPFYGKKHSASTLRFLKEFNKGKLPPNAKAVKIGKQTFDSAAEASRELGIHITTILYRIKSTNPKFNDYTLLNA